MVGVEGKKSLVVNTHCHPVLGKDVSTVSLRMTDCGQGLVRPFVIARGLRNDHCPGVLGELDLAGAPLLIHCQLGVEHRTSHVQHTAPQAPRYS